MIGPKGATEEGPIGTGEPRLPGPASQRDPRPWAVRGGTVPLLRPLVVGVLNLTPDSFSDGGALPDVQTALGRAEAMVAEGAGMLDVGGESTRPGAQPVPAGEQLARVLPFVEAAAKALPVPISVDTRSAEVARACLEAGAAVVNDVSGLAHDPDVAGVVAEVGAGVILMHMRGDPTTMASLASYRHLTRDVADELSESVGAARAAGIAHEAIVVDPGIGFAKSPAQSLAILGALDSILALGYPVMVGPSRKSFMADLLGVPAPERQHGTVAACIAAYLQGARIFRVHDVGPVVQALRVIAAIQEAAEAVPRRDP